MLKRIKTITGYAPLARWLAEVEDGTQFLARSQTLEIPSPYRYSPSVGIDRWNGKDVVWFETRHRRYEVYEVPASMERFESDAAATDRHIADTHK